MILYFSTKTIKVFQMWTSTVCCKLKIYIKPIILWGFLVQFNVCIENKKMRLDKDIKKNQPMPLIIREQSCK